MLRWALVLNTFVKLFIEAQLAQALALLAYRGGCVMLFLL